MRIKGYSVERKTYGFLSGLIIAILVCLLFAPMAQASQLVFGLDTAPDRLIPIKIKNPQTFPVSMQIFQGLFDLDEQGRVIPCIVESWDTKDYQNWLFRIRKGVYFHRSPIFENGTREVTAEDVLYSLTRFCSADAYNAFLLTGSVRGAAEYNQGKTDRVKGLSLIDKYTIKVELIKPERFFLNCLSNALICIFPKEADRKEYAEKVGFSIAVGTGPYMLVSRTETEIVLKKNDNYWNRADRPHIEKIIFRVIKSDQARFVNLKRRNIDMMVLPNSLFSSVFNRDGTLRGHEEGRFETKEKYRVKKRHPTQRDYITSRYQIKTASTFNTHFIGINNKAVPDVNLRRAIFWGTNRGEIIDSILYGYADETGGAVPPGINGYRPPFGKILFDPEKARTYLRKSNYKGEPLALLIHDIAESEQVGQIFQAQMAEIDIRIVLRKLDFNSVISRMVKGECQLFSMFFEYVFSSPEPILINLFSTSKIPVPNFFQFSNPSVDKMLISLYRMKSEKESVDYCARISARIMADAPASFLYRQKYVILYPKDMTGLEISGNNHYFLEKIRFKK